MIKNVRIVLVFEKKGNNIYELEKI